MNSIESLKIIGVLNLTPDSFSDGGDFLDQVTAVAHAKALFANGANIVDVGAESTGPGSTPVSAEEELRRLGNIVEEITAFGAVSVDTYKAVVAERALAQGTAMINDVSALRADPEMAAVVSAHQARLIMMYAKDSPLPHVTAYEPNYGESGRELISVIVDFLSRRVDAALAAGIKESQLVLDPGMGRFLGSDPKLSWLLLERFEELVVALKPFPILVGTSRKNFLAREGSLAPKERDALSASTALHAVRCGATYVRTHNPGRFHLSLQKAQN